MKLDEPGTLWRVVAGREHRKVEDEGERSGDGLKNEMRM